MENPSNPMARDLAMLIQLAPFLYAAEASKDIICWHGKWPEIAH
jgi:hypothetical protein